MAAVNKKNNKKNKSSLNTKKVIVNSNKISDDPPAPVESDVTKPSADLDVNEFEDFYNKALKEYINFRMENLQKRNSNNLSLPKLQDAA